MGHCTNRVEYARSPFNVRLWFGPWCFGSAVCLRRNKSGPRGAPAISCDRAEVRPAVQALD
eukprot:9002635-Alexandrium_andersonii.AAC.1